MSDQAASQDAPRGFYETAAADPRRIAIHCEGEVITFGALLSRVNRWSHLMQLLSLERGDGVCIVLPNSPALVEVQLAGEQIGLYVTPVNWHLTVPEIAYIVSDSGASLVVTTDDLADVVEDAARQAGIDSSRVFTYRATGPRRDVNDALAQMPAHAPATRRSGAVQYYSSGTTGRPKGIMRPLPDADPDEMAFLRSIERLRQLRFREGPGTHLVVAPMYHSAPNANALASLHAGSALAISRRFDPVETLALIDRHRVATTFMVPLMFHRLLQLDPGIRAGFDVSSLAVVVHAGAPCPPHVKAAMIDWWGLVIYEYYGTSEYGTATFISPEEWLVKPGSVGRPVPGIDLRLVDDTGAEVPLGEVGEIYVRGGYAYEYRGMIAPSTAPDLDAQGYRTAGDLGWRDGDGYLFIADRRTDLIISGGVNIYPAEIEAAILSCPIVADAVVVPAPDEEWGQRVVAVIALRPGESQDGAAGRISAHLVNQLAGFKRPREIRFVSQLPRTETGKLSRAQIAATLAANSPPA
jgi:long-chain acyl-CoA synthetase